MATGRQVDYLFWAVAEARRLRGQDELGRGAGSAVRVREPNWPTDGFVTEWQSAEQVVSLPS